MIRKLLLLAATIVALTLATLAPPVSATPTAVPPTSTPTTCTVTGYNGCLGYPSGGFGDGNVAADPTSTPTPAPLATATTVPVEDVTATSTAGGEASIAFTGAESRVLGYVGAGLIGFGTIALAAARRKNGADN